MVRGGGVGTGLGVGAGFWDWEIPHPFTRLLVKPRSFLKVFTACLRNLLADRVSGETSDWLQVGQMCSSESSKAVRIQSSQ